MPIDNIAVWMAHFALILTRMSALFILSPVLGRGNTPAMLKTGTALCTSLILINVLPAPDILPWNTLAGFIIAVVMELAVGFIIGYINTLFFSIVFTAGQIIDMQIGFGMVQVFDQQTNTQVPIVGSLLNLIVLEVFLLSDGHLTLIRLMYKTFDVLPVGQVSFDPNIALFILEAFAVSFALAIRVAIPIIAAGLMAEVGLGIIVRTAPQMNIFVLGIPLKLIIGLVMLMLIVPVFTGLTGSVFNTMFSYMEGVLQGYAPGG